MKFEKSKTVTSKSGRLSVAPIDSQKGYVLLMVFVFLLVLGMIVGYLMTSTMTSEKEVGVVTDQDTAMQNAELALKDAQLDILGKLYDNTFALNANGISPGSKKIQGKLDAKGNQLMVSVRRSFTRPYQCNEKFLSSNEEVITNYNLNCKLDDPNIEMYDINPVSNDPVNCPSGGYDCARIPLKWIMDDIDKPDPPEGVYSPGLGLLKNCPDAKPWEVADWGDFQTDKQCGTSKLPTVEYGKYTGASYDTQNGVPKPRYMIEVLFPDQMNISTNRPHNSEMSVISDTDNSHTLMFRITAIGFGARETESLVKNSKGEMVNGRMHVMLQEVVAP